MNNEYTYLQNKKWRAITYNWENLSSYSSYNSKLYCLTDFQAAWLLSNTAYMAWSTRWQNCPCTPGELQSMQSELDYNLMSCFDFQPYQLQYLYQAENNSQLALFDSLWNGSDPSSVNTEAPDDYFDGDASSDREDALCTAISLWGYSYAADWSTKASLVLGLAYGASSLITALVPVGGNIAVEVVADLLEPLQAQVEALNDIAALDTVLCDWKTALEGVAINVSNWNSAVDSLVYTTDTNEWYIQQLFAADTALLDNFLSFVNALGDAYGLAQMGVFICACAEEIQLCFSMDDLSDIDLYDYTEDSVFGNPLPSLQGNTILDYENFPYLFAPTSNSVFGGSVVYEFDATVEVVRASFDWYSDIVAPPNTNFCRRQITLYDASDNVLASQFQSGINSPAWRNQEFTFNQSGVRKIAWFTFISTTASITGGDMWLDNACVTYVG